MTPYPRPLRENEYRSAQRLKGLYAAFNCAGTLRLCAVQDPARLGWRPIVKVEHYVLEPQAISQSAESG